MAFSTQKDFFHVPFMNETVEYECRRAPIQLKSYDSTIDDRSWALDETNRSRFLTDLVTCQSPVSSGYEDDLDAYAPGSRGGRGTRGRRSTGDDMHIDAADSLIAATNVTLDKVQGLLQEKRALQQRLQSSEENLKTTKAEFDKIKDILSRKFDRSDFKDFYNKIQKLAKCGNFTKCDEKDFMQFFKKMEDLGKSFEVAQAENSYLKRLLEKLSKRAEVDKIPVEPETCTDICYLQDQVNKLRKELIALRNAEDNKEKCGESPEFSIDSETIKAIIKERNALRDRLSSMQDIEEQVFELRKRLTDASDVSNNLSHTLNSKSKYINDMENEMREMQSHYEKREEQRGCKEDCLRRKLDEMKKQLCSSKLEAQKVPCLNSCIRRLEKAVEEKDNKIREYDCQLKQLLRVISELRSSGKGSGRCTCMDDSTQTGGNDFLDDLAFYTSATLGEIMKELKRRGLVTDECSSPCASKEPQMSAEECSREVERLRRIIAKLQCDKSCLSMSLSEHSKNLEELSMRVDEMGNEIKQNGYDTAEVGKDLNDARRLVDDINDMQGQNQALMKAHEDAFRKEQEKALLDLHDKLKSCLEDKADFHYILQQKGIDPEQALKELEIARQKGEAPKRGTIVLPLLPVRPGGGPGGVGPGGVGPGGVGPGGVGPGGVGPGGMRPSAIARAGGVGPGGVGPGGVGPGGVGPGGVGPGGVGPGGVGGVGPGGVGPGGVGGVGPGGVGPGGVGPGGVGPGGAGPGGVGPGGIGPGGVGPGGVGPGAYGPGGVGPGGVGPGGVGPGGVGPGGVGPGGVGPGGVGPGGVGPGGVGPGGFGPGGVGPGGVGPGGVGPGGVGPGGVGPGGAGPGGAGPGGVGPGGVGPGGVGPGGVGPGGVGPGGVGPGGVGPGGFGPGGVGAGGVGPGGAGPGGVGPGGAGPGGVGPGGVGPGGVGPGGIGPGGAGPGGVGPGGVGPGGAGPGGAGPGGVGPGGVGPGGVGPGGVGPGGVGPGGVGPGGVGPGGVGPGGVGPGGAGPGGVGPGGAQAGAQRRSAIGGLPGGPDGFDGSGGPGGASGRVVPGASGVGTPGRGGYGAGGRVPGVGRSPGSQQRGSADKYSDFLSRNANNLAMNLQAGHPLEKELRKILDAFVDECRHCLCQVKIPKSKFYAICHKILHQGIMALSFKEVAYLHKKIYYAAEKLYPGCLLNVIVTEYSDIAQEMKKCCQCKSALCCDSSQEMLKEKVRKLEIEVEMAKNYLDSIRAKNRTNTFIEEEDEEEDDYDDRCSTYRQATKRSSPKYDQKQMKSIKACVTRCSSRLK